MTVENQMNHIQPKDKVELNNGNTGVVLWVKDNHAEVQITTKDGLTYERKMPVSQLKKVS